MASIPETDEPTPFVVPPNRTGVTDEPEPRYPRPDSRFPDVSWIGTAQQGGGHVPEDFQWPTNPKQRQDDLMGEWEPAQH